MFYDEIMFDIILSWREKYKSVNTLQDILLWIEDRNKNLKVNIDKISLKDDRFWYYDDQDGKIKNSNNSFFSINGINLTKLEHDKLIEIEQPIILQDEIGFLGIICKKINGIMYFLMQAKIEPGNINKIQISPTIQATKSNFMQKHGGKRPAYLEYFLNVKKEQIIVDQIQSEQSSRFLKKRNRNIIIFIEEDIDVLPSHKWMTLYQIKQLMKFENLVNMDTRTVLSCLPFSKCSFNDKQLQTIAEKFDDKFLFKSIFEFHGNKLPEIFNKINNYKMFVDTRYELLPLKKLRQWTFTDNELICQKYWPFKVIFCKLAIEGREVKEWTQPLFAAEGSALFGLICSDSSGCKEFLVKLKGEIGCFDKVEIGPTVQNEALEIKPYDNVENIFYKKFNKNEGVIFSNVLSEEGGRFYHEQNRNVIINIDKSELNNLPEHYMWIDFRTLCDMIQFNNVINIQLRNLLSVLEG